MGKPIGVEYRRAAGETIYYAVFATLFAGIGVFALARWGSTSGLVFIVSATFAYQAIQSRRLPYAVVNAETLTVWITPSRAQTVAWRTLTSARRVGQRVRLGLPEGKTLDLRWDAVVPDAREGFLAEFAAHLDARWIDDQARRVERRGLDSGAAEHGGE